jgi:hypothetical protein
MNIFIYLGNLMKELLPFFKFAFSGLQLALADLLVHMAYTLLNTFATLLFLNLDGILYHKLSCQGYFGIPFGESQLKMASPGLVGRITGMFNK